MLLISFMRRENSCLFFIFNLFFQLENNLVFNWLCFINELLKAQWMYADFSDCAYTAGCPSGSCQENFLLSGSSAWYQIRALHWRSLLGFDNASCTKSVPGQVYRDTENVSPNYWKYVFLNWSEGKLNSWFVLVW